MGARYETEELVSWMRKCDAVRNNHCENHWTRILSLHVYILNPNRPTKLNTASITYLQHFWHPIVRFLCYTHHFSNSLDTNSVFFIFNLNFNCQDRAPTGPSGMGLLQQGYPSFRRQAQIGNVTTKYLWPTELWVSVPTTPLLRLDNLLASL